MPVFYIAGEDAVTKAVIKRLCSYCFKDYKIIQEIPARGSEILNKIPELNRLAANSPVIALIDLDNDYCPPKKKQGLLHGKQNNDFLLNIAVDEAEAWLLADRDGFSNYFAVDINLIPQASFQKLGGRKPAKEIYSQIKTSMFITKSLAPKSKNPAIKKQLTPKPGASKGPEYNSCVLPFINNRWNIENAAKNSDSLNSMINRLKMLSLRYP